MQAIFQIILAVLSALKSNPKKSIAAGAVGAGALTMGLYASGPSMPRATSHLGNTLGLPGNEGDVITRGATEDTYVLAPPAGGSGLDATGITDGYVPTADGANDWDWEAPAAGSGITTPDGVTTSSRLPFYNVRDYGASGKRTIFRATWATSGTTTVTTKDASNVATAHDFEVGNGLILLNAGPACAVDTPDVSGSRASVTVNGTPGSTTYSFTFVAFDGLGGHTAASTHVQTTTGAAALNLTDNLTLKIPVPWGAGSVAVYDHVSGRLITVLETGTRFYHDGSTPPGNSVALTETSGGSGVARLTVTSGHGIQVGDVINVRATTSGDSAYDGEYVVSAVDTTTIDLGAASYLGSGNATVYWKPGWVTWKFSGYTAPLHVSKGMPDVPNAPYAYRANIVVPRGNPVITTSDGYLMRVTNARADRLSSSEPTWTDSLTTQFRDNDLIFMRDIGWVSTTEPGSAMRQALLTTVATVPTSSTFTTTDAASADNSSHTPIYLAHNDALAFRAALAAATAEGKGGEIWIEGNPQIYLPKAVTGSAYWSEVPIAVPGNPVFTFLPLRTGTANIPAPVPSFRLAPGAVVDTYMMQYGGIIEDLGIGGNSAADYTLIQVQGDDVAIDGGIWNWNIFQGGLTEHEQTGSSYAADVFFFGDQGAANVVNLGSRPRTLRLSNTRVDWPTFFSGNGVVEDDLFSYRKLLFENVQLHYGGGDGDYGGLPKGMVRYLGGEIFNVRRLGSVGIYLNHNQAVQVVDGVVFRATGKHPIQVRGSSGDGWSKKIIISNCTGVNCVQAMLIGDITTSNRNHEIAISACNGFDLRLAECRGLTLTGGNWGSIQVQEDCANIKFANLVCESLDLTSGTAELNADVTCKGVTVRSTLKVANVQDSELDGFTFIDPRIRSTNLVSYLYEWIATGSNNEYYCRLRSTGGDPGISSPAGVLVRDRFTTTAGSLGSLANDSWYYGDPDGGGAISYSTVVVKIGDSDRFDPDANPFGTVWTGTMSGAGVVFAGTVTKVKLENFLLKKTVENRNPIVSMTGSSLAMTDVTLENFLTDFAGLTVDSNQTVRLWDMNTAWLAAEGVYIRKCKWKHPRQDSGSSVSVCVRLNLTRGGTVAFEDCDFPVWGSNGNSGSDPGGITGSTGMAGCINMKRCRVQSNEGWFTVNTGTGVLSLSASDTNNVDLRDSSYTSQAVRVERRSLTLPTPMSGSITSGDVLFARQSTGKLYPTAADAAADTNAYAFTAAGTGLWLVFMDSARNGFQSVYEYAANPGSPDLWGEMEDNQWRNSKVATYAQITGDQNQYALIPLLDEHRLSTDASRTINGIKAIGKGTAAREVTIYNIGAQDIVFAHESGSAAVEDQITCPGASSFTLTPGNALVLKYEPGARKWRLKATSISMLSEPLMEIGPRMAQWAIEPKRAQLALAA